MNTTIYRQAKRAAVSNRPDLIKGDGEINVSALSRASGVTQPTLKRIFDGEIKRPTSTTLKKIAKALRVSIDTLLATSPDRKSVVGGLSSNQDIARLKREISEMLDDLDLENLEEAARFLRLVVRR